MTQETKAIEPALRYFDDITTGEVIHAGPIEVTREAIIAFAQTYDPQPFHLDEAAAAASLLGGLAASGWHTVAIGMRLYFDGFLHDVASMGAPGVDEVRWLRPVRPGDALSLVLTVGEKRASSSREDRGYVAMTLDVRTAGGATVMTWRCPLIVQRREAQTVPVAASTDAIVPYTMPAPPPADPVLTAFLDDVPIGHKSTLGLQLFTPELITGYAKLYDPQYFHTDPEAAKASQFGSLIASGWQTAAFWMKQYIAARERSADARETAGWPVAIGGPSPGFEKMQWLRPVRAGEIVTYSTTVLDKRRTGRLGWGLISMRNTGHTADGTLVFTFDGRILWPLSP